MSCRLSILSALPILAILGFVSLDATGAEDKPPARQTQPSEPKSEEVATNSTPSGRGEGLKHLEEDLLKPLQEMSPKSSLDGIFAPPLRPPAPPSIQSKRVKELLERRKNWIFMNPEDLMSAPSAEEMFKLPEYTADGRNKKDVSPLERYYKNLERRGKTGKSKDPFENEDMWGVDPKKQDAKQDDSDKKDDDNLPGSVKEKEQALRKAFEADKDASGDDEKDVKSSRKSFFTDIFGLGHPDLTPEEKAAQKARKKVMQELYAVPGLPTLPGSSDLESLMSDLGTPSAKTPAPLPKTYVPEKSDAFNPNLGMNDPTFIQGAPKDPTAKLLNDWNTAPTMPKLDPPQYFSPPPPTFAAPKRPF